MHLSVATLSAILATLAQAAPTPQAIHDQIANLQPQAGHPVVPVPEHAVIPRPQEAHNSNDVVSAASHSDLLNNNGVNALGGKAGGGVGKRQLPGLDKVLSTKRQHNSDDIVSVLGDTSVANNNGLSVAGDKAAGGIGKRQHNSDDIVSVLGHTSVTNNNGLNVAGGEAAGGIGKRQANDIPVVGPLLGSGKTKSAGKRQDHNRDDIANVLGETKVLDNNSINILGQDAAGGAVAPDRFHHTDEHAQPQPAIPEPRPTPGVVPAHPVGPEFGPAQVVGPSFRANQVNQ